MIPKAIPMEIRHIVFLLCFFILYVIFGGFVFMLLESPEEEIKRKEVEIILNNFSEHIKQLNQTRLTEQYIRNMINKLLVAQENNLIDNYGNQSQYINWSFINSFFFAITVITTIGYGHLTPSTVFGKIFCIVYALFGIPITSLLIGSLADRFSKLYSPKDILRKRHLQRQLSVRILMLKKGLLSLVPWFFAFLIVPAIIFTCIEKWSFIDGFYYCFVTLSTIGFGDFVAGSFEKDYIWVYKILVVFWIVFGLAYLSMILNFITQSLRIQHISNVMHSLRHRISANPTLANRINRHNEHFHSEHGKFKRQQSTPVIFFTHNGKRIFGKRDNLGKMNNINSSINNSNNTPCDCVLTNNLSINNNPIVSDTDSNCKLPSTATETIRKSRFFNFFKNLKTDKIQQQTKSSIRSAFEDNATIHHTNSLPELTVEYNEPSCSLEEIPKISVV